MEEMTWIKAHEKEKFGDIKDADIFRPCRTCKWRDKTAQGYIKFICDVFPKEDPKPLTIMYNGDCDFYEKE